MSEELQGKLRSHQDKKSVQEFLSKVSGLEVISYDSERQDLTAVEKAVATTRLYSSVPNSRIEIGQHQGLPEDWIESVLSQCKIQTSVYLHLSDFHGAGWLHVKFNQVENSLSSIWQNLSAKSIEIVSEDLSDILVISEEEHYIEAFWQRI